MRAGDRSAVVSNAGEELVLGEVPVVGGVPVVGEVLETARARGPETGSMTARLASTVTKAARRAREDEGAHEREAETKDEPTRARYADALLNRKSRS